MILFLFPSYYLCHHPVCHDVLIFTSCTTVLAHVTDTSTLTILLILRFVSCVSNFSKQLPNTSSNMFSNFLQDMGYDTMQLLLRLLTAAQKLDSRFSPGELIKKGTEKDYPLFAYASSHNCSVVSHSELCV